MKNWVVGSMLFPQLLLMTLYTMAMLKTRWQVKLSNWLDRNMLNPQLLLMTLSIRAMVQARWEVI